ncbi:MAG TPA: D-aminoacylase, partial [Thermomicrobiales bacterium]|nr:D-aminoacylase [Thermomicrobiales bacterium]
MSDLLITGGRIVDGTGNPWFYGDVAVTGDIIERIAPPGTIDPGTSTTVIDATDHVVSPGFIDIQSHSIRTFFTDRRSLSKVTQGVTTEIMGELWTPAPVGGQILTALDSSLAERGDEDIPEWVELAKGWSRFGDWLAELEKRTVSVNFGSFLGGGTLREYACGLRMGDATEDEIAVMQRAVA